MRMGTGRDGSGRQRVGIDDRYRCNGPLGTACCGCQLELSDGFVEMLWNVLAVNNDEMQRRHPKHSAQRPVGSGLPVTRFE